MKLLNKIIEDNPNYFLDVLPQEELIVLNTSCYPEIPKNRYWVSNKNRIYDNKNKKYLSVSHTDPKKNSSPYHKTSINNKSYSMHRLIMMTFEPLDSSEKMKNMQINHKDGDKLNNELWNLEWCTPKDNTLHAYYTGLFVPVYGEDHCCATITDKQAKLICDMIASRKYKQREIAEIVGTSLSIVSDISMGKSWKHISKEYDFLKKKHRVPKNFSFEQINQCCKYFQDHKKDQSQSLRSYIIDCLNFINFDGIYGEGNLNSIRLLYERKRYEFISDNYNY